MALFIGRVSSYVTSRELEDLFKEYGKLDRVSAKGRYAFVTFTDERDAEEAMEKLQGHVLDGTSINIEWAKESGRFNGNSRRREFDSDDRKCYNCDRVGHIAKNCRERRRSRSRDRYSRRDRSRDRYSRRDRSRDRYSRRDRSPRRDSRSPRRERSPRRDSRSPRRERSPRRDSRSPRRDSRSPRRERSSVSPRRDSPARESRSPVSPGSPSQD
eukprot:TRINITY_DN550_c0_g1_i2.p1 TRINITY_DN550_c0_g1~~TRINITY_DN550_c0_g1_i2.p1  ORF type:complete len:214 (+),score=63.68 TRINITY_DN550_c0_g1_i2:52-693(+)